MTPPSIPRVQQRHTRIAAAVASALLLCPSVPRTARAGASDESAAAAMAALESELATAPAELKTAVGTLLSALAEASIPAAPLVRKVREGLGKGIPPARLAPALAVMAGNMTWLHGQLATCTSAGTGSAALATPCVVRWLEVGNEVLLGGLGRAALAGFVATVCRARQPERTLSALAELYFHLTGRLHASAPAAWSFAAQVAQRQADEGAVNRVVVVLQDIHRRRGPPDVALHFAAARLEGGTPLHRIRYELQERYLRQ